MDNKRLRRAKIYLTAEHENRDLDRVVLSHEDRHEEQRGLERQQSQEPSLLRTGSDARELPCHAAAPSRGKIHLGAQNP